MCHDGLGFDMVTAGGVKSQSLDIVDIGDTVIAGVDVPARRRVK